MTTLTDVQKQSIVEFLNAKIVESPLSENLWDADTATLYHPPWLDHATAALVCERLADLRGAFIATRPAPPGGWIAWRVGTPPSADHEAPTQPLAAMLAVAAALETP